MAKLKGTFSLREKERKGKREMQREKARVKVSLSILSNPNHHSKFHSMASLSFSLSPSLSLFHALPFFRFFLLVKISAIEKVAIKIMFPTLREKRKKVQINSVLKLMNLSSQFSSLLVFLFSFFFRKRKRERRRIERRRVVTDDFNWPTTLLA